MIFPVLGQFYVLEYNFLWKNLWYEKHSEVILHTLRNLYLPFTCIVWKEKIGKWQIEGCKVVSKMKKSTDVSVYFHSEDLHLLFSVIVLHKSKLSLRYVLLWIAKNIVFHLMYFSKQIPAWNDFSGNIMQVFQISN